MSKEEAIRQDERIITTELVVKDLKKRLKAGLRPHASESPGSDSNMSVHWNPEHVAAQERYLKQLIRVYQVKARELRHARKMRERGSRK